MKLIRTICLCLLLMPTGGVSAQLVGKVLGVLGEDSVATAPVEPADSDSIRLSLVRQELETSRLNEANLRMELEQLKLESYAADSLKLAGRGGVSTRCGLGLRACPYWWKATPCSVSMPSGAGVLPCSGRKMWAWPWRLWASGSTCAPIRFT